VPLSRLHFSSVSGRCAVVVVQRSIRRSFDHTLLLLLRAGRLVHPVYSIIPSTDQQAVLSCHFEMHDFIIRVLRPSTTACSNNDARTTRCRRMET